MVVNFSLKLISILTIQNLGNLKLKIQRMQNIIHTIIEQIKNISILLNPIIPISTKKF